MNRRQSFDLSFIIGVVTLAAAVGVVSLIGLNSLATPARYGQRLDDLNRRTDDVEARLASPGQPFAYPAGAVCAEAPDAAAIALKNRISALASASSVTLSKVEAAPGSINGADGGLTPVSLSFDASGAYQSVLSFLGNVSASEPEVFVSSADLKSQTTAVGFHFEGRIYCSA